MVLFIRQPRAHTLNPSGSVRVLDGMMWDMMGGLVHQPAYVHRGETVRHARLGFHCHALAYHSRGAPLDGGFEEPNGTVAGWLVRQRLPID